MSDCPIKRRQFGQNIQSLLRRLKGKGCLFLSINITRGPFQTQRTVSVRNALLQSGVTSHSPCPGKDTWEMPVPLAGGRCFAEEGIDWLRTSPYSSTSNPDGVALFKSSTADFQQDTFPVDYLLIESQRPSVQLSTTY